jgi:hypothetical protein
MPSDSAAEIAYLRARCHLIVDFCESKDPTFRLGDQLRAVIKSTADAANVRGMRTIRRDLLDMSQGLAQDDRVALKALLDKQADDDPSNRRAG